MAQDAIIAFAAEKLDAIEARNLYRRLRPTARGSLMRAEREGRALVSFSDNDYLGLSADPRVKQAAAQAALDHGAGAGASRLVTGDCPLYADLEARLAVMKGTEAALVFCARASRPRRRSASWSCPRRCFPWMAIWRLWILSRARAPIMMRG